MFEGMYEFLIFNLSGCVILLYIYELLKTSIIELYIYVLYLDSTSISNCSIATISIDLDYYYWHSHRLNQMYCLSYS